MAMRDPAISVGTTSKWGPFWTKMRSKVELIALLYWGIGSKAPIPPGGTILTNLAVHAPFVY